MNFWSRNIDARGRGVRIVTSIMLGAACVVSAVNGWRSVAILLGISAAFVLYEGVSGWCALRACGIKTRI